MVLAATLFGFTAPFLAVAVSLSITPPSQPNLPPTTLTVTNEVIAPDGFKRSAILGSKFRFNVENDLTDTSMLMGTSIHWHGFFQKGTNYVDGVAGVSQCPISPKESFLYEFTANDQAGTFWYHSHFGTQYCDGLRGPFVVYDDNDPLKWSYDVDDANTVITLSEWYHTPSPSIPGIASAASVLINGKGRYTGGPAVPLSIINVEKSKRYRLRVINIACDVNFMFSIDGHPLLAIEADGENIVPYATEQIQIFAGQRYSVVIFTNQKVDNYRIRALPNSGSGNLPFNYTGGINSAILRYKGAPNAEPTSSEKKSPRLLQEAELRPLLLDPRAPGKPYPGGADVNINLDIEVNFQTSRFLMNNVSYSPPSVPVLLQILSGARAAQELMPSGSVYTLPRNKVVEITIPGGSIGGPHPFHLHGHSFAVIKSANATKPNYKNPVRRDVVNIGEANSNVTIRFVTDNPGPWFLHWGLAVVFAEDTGDTPSVDAPTGQFLLLTLCSSPDTPPQLPGRTYALHTMPYQPQ
ncbi:hypothetical protein C0991_000692 [Blastosporella zonata]|nr:hypothetical protein C0991_000692 [Blastosporella zonata]